MSRLLCPTCGNHLDPTNASALPFCSSRCREIDFRRWLGENYGLPVDPSDSDQEPDDDGEPDALPGQSAGQSE